MTIAMIRQRSDIRHAILLSLLMVTLSRAAMGAAKYVSASATTAVIIAIQFLLCTLQYLLNIEQPRLRSLHLRGLSIDCDPVTARGLTAVLFSAIGGRSYRTDKLFGKLCSQQ